jgi:dTDP-4-dehydrorhamnose reductase
LLIGINGQVGQELRPLLAPLGNVIGLDRTTLDLTQPDAIRDAIATYSPHLIINAAAYNAVDRAETESELAQTVNAIAPTIMAEAADRLGAALIHISSNYVFDGQTRMPYTEADIPNPINQYGHSKLAGEWGIQQACDRHIILRTAWVYGAYGTHNFVKTMLTLAAQQDELQVVADQFSTPTWAYDVAIAIAQFAQSILTHASNPVSTGSQHWLKDDVYRSRLSCTSVKLDWGIYHLTNRGLASWYTFAVAIIEEAKRLGFPLQVQRVIPIPAADYPTPANRPAYSALDHQKISHHLERQPAPWRERLRQMLIMLQTCPTCP